MWPPFAINCAMICNRIVLVLKQKSSCLNKHQQRLIYSKEHGHSTDVIYIWCLNCFLMPKASMDTELTITYLELDILHLRSQDNFVMSVKNYLLLLLYNIVVRDYIYCQE